MPANTTRGYPYPLPTEPVAEGAQAIRNLAEYIDPRTPLRLSELVLAAAGSFDFQSIPQTFRHLQFVGKASAATLTEISARLNNDSGNNYEGAGLVVLGTAAPANVNITPNRWRVGQCGGAGSEWVAFTFMIPNYTATTRKHYVSEAGGYNASGLYRESMGGRYTGAAAAITRVTIFGLSVSLDAGSVCSLYGLP